jgi:hypothetical protein
MQWDAGVYYAVAGDTTRSIDHLKRLLELRPDRLHDVLLFSWRTFDDPDAVWQTLITPLQNVQIQTAYLDFLVANGRPDMASRYWPEVVPKIGGTPFAVFRLYLQRLLEAQQYEQASRVWRDLLNGGIVTSNKTPCLPDGAPSNLVFNPCFERPLHGGFDWLTPEQQCATVDFPAHDKNETGLQIDFSVPRNSDCEPVYEVVPIAPNATYELTASVRSEGITSDSGPRLRVVDLRCPTCLSVSTDGTTGTTDWHQLRLTFASGAATTFASVSVWRPPSRAYPMEISGRAWFDAITLRQIESPK